ncbi:unnamed protein product [Larinioides sclopetarius]|uniref:Uncharacterized protein n=1 Tax=Larinioides sclopetarius TaxID=280406 RepID=A0AAV2A7Y2_9ARAC
MSFLCKEVESEEMINLARTGLGTPQRPKAKYIMEEPSLATNVGLTNLKGDGSGKYKCVFCSKLNHRSSDCFFAKKLSLSDRKAILIRNHACFKCLGREHNARSCRLKMLKCMNCNEKNHHTLLCNKNEKLELKESESNETTISNTLANHSQITDVYLQTIVLKLCNNGKEIILRCLLDSGSQNSYLTQRIIDNFELQPVSKQTIVHGLFGGRETAPKKHFLFNVVMKSMDNSFTRKIKVFSERKICGYLPKINDLQVLSEIKEKGIILPDLCDSAMEIDLLLGAGVISVILSGNAIKLRTGLIAIETMLGFTIMGKSNDIMRNTSEIPVTARPDSHLCILFNQLNVKELWDMEVIGIRDPIDNVKNKLQQLDMIERFQRNLVILSDGRYEVSLPFKLEYQLTDNKEQALKRHKRICKNIDEKNCLKEYSAIFNEWKALQIIERVPVTEIRSDAYYLPHIPVFKEFSTTKIRPVFDASTRDSNGLSLNACLHRGPNMIELIPDVLDRFRTYPIGLSADIEKAFLQISVTPEHRNFLRFFFPHEDDEILYRHCRVVFGVCSSPFLLAATINHLLDNSSEYADFALKLRHSFYVDNCVTGVLNEQEIELFVNKAQEIMTKGCFNLRGWERKAVLTYEELLTVACDCESIINSRPLTYVSEDSNDLVPITPAMFLMTNTSLDVTDLDLSEFSKFQKRVKFRAKLLKDIKGRFRREYLGLLVQRPEKTKSQTLKVGEIALVENPNKKRLFWPLSRIIELIPGRDGKIRTLKLKCCKSVIIRPIQRVFPLEIQPTGVDLTNDIVQEAKPSSRIPNNPPSTTDDTSGSTIMPTDMVKVYTGFCPGLTEQVGVSYAWATYAVMSKDPKIGKRLAPIKAPQDKYKAKSPTQGQGSDNPSLG